MVPNIPSERYIMEKTVETMSHSDYVSSLRSILYLEEEMRIAIVFWVTLLVLEAGLAAHAWAQGAGMPHRLGMTPSYPQGGQYQSLPRGQYTYPSGYPAPPGQSAPAGSYPQYGPNDQPQAPGYADTAQAPYPTYPYPAYHNPYYTGTSPKDLLANTIEWVFSFPANVMDRVSNFMDSHVFPRVPATSGSSQEPVSGEAFQPAAPDAAVPAGPNSGLPPGTQ